MSNYPGNTALASAVKERVNSTFQQAVELYRLGRMDEVISGCTLILQMDPLFDPAKRLLEKTRNPASPTDVESLMPPAVGAGLDEARAAMANRDFERVLALTTEILTNDLMNDAARELADEAREKLEAAPFIDQFVRKCEQSVNNGNLPAARMDLEKARALDASHPGVRRIEQIIAAKEASGPAASSSSFVVDTPAPASGRSTAQASDFGFTFEEEKAGDKQSFTNFSFDSPSQPAAPGKPAASKPAASKPAATPQQGGGFSGFSFDAGSTPSAESPFGGGFSFDTPVSSPTTTPAMSFETPQKGPGNEFDFSTASIETSPDDQKKIDQYLSDGDKAFDADNYQQAIDLWSRIFLIDVTNDAASERIERAKGKRREAEQRIESVLGAGVQAFERRDTATARARMTEVLQLDPNNVTAQDYMERLESPGKASGPAPVAEPSYESSVLEEQTTGDMYEGPAPEPFGAPRRGAAKPAPSPRAASGARKPAALIAVVIIAVAVIGGGWFAWSKFMAAPKSDPSAARASFDRATDYASQGKYDLAISALQDIKPGDKDYDKALVLIADLQQKKARAATLVDGRPAGAYFEDNLAAGRTAFQSHDYVSAKKSFEQAMRVKPLPADAKSSYDIAAQQVAKLDNARALFAEHKYQDVITSLQPLLVQDPQNKNIQRMIVDSHFNLGASALQDERLTDARSEFDEVLKADPNDDLARRSKDLADRYDGQPKDLLYKIYVKYLPLRQAPAA